MGGGQGIFKHHTALFNEGAVVQREHLNPRHRSAAHVNQHRTLGLVHGNVGDVPGKVAFHPPGGAVFVIHLSANVLNAAVGLKGYRQHSVPHHVTKQGENPATNQRSVAIPHDSGRCLTAQVIQL